MGKIGFTDGMEFDTSGAPRLVRKSDGYYVVGDGMLCPVDSAQEGQELIQQMTKKQKPA